jgi:hypothetical protein
MPAGCYLASYQCKPVSLSLVTKSEPSFNLGKIHTIISQRETVYSSNSMVRFPSFHAAISNALYLEQVYGITFLQLFGAVTDSALGYYQVAGGWSQPDAIDPSQASTVVAWFDVLPLPIDALSKSRITFHRQI